MSDTTKEGLRLSAASTPAQVTRGDTAWLVLTYTNPRATDVWLQTPCGSPEQSLITSSKGVPLFGTQLVFCGDPWGNEPDSVRVPAGGTLERRFPFTGEIPRFSPSGGVDCARPDTYTVTWTHREPAGARRVRPVTSTVQLRESAARAAACQSWLPAPR